VHVCSWRTRNVHMMMMMMMMMMKDCEDYRMALVCFVVVSA